MAIRLRFEHVIVQRSSIERCADIPEYLRELDPGGGFQFECNWYDEHLYCMTSMSTSDSADQVREWQSRGLAAHEIGIVSSHQQPDCEWLEFDPNDNCVWLRGTKKGKLIGGTGEGIEVNTQLDWAPDDLAGVDLPQTMFDVAAMLADGGEYTAAINICDQLIAQDAEDLAALNLKDSCLISAGQPTEALPFLRKACLRRPDHAPIRCALAQALDEAGDCDGALAEYDEALRLDSDNWEARGWRGELRGRLGDTAGALADFDRLVIIRQDAHSYMLRGYTHLIAGMHSQAHSDFLRAIDLDASVAPTIDEFIRSVMADPDATATLSGTASPTAEPNEDTRRK